MGRGERPVDPEAGAVERFAYELRQLRQRSGAPTYRRLAEQTHYSVTALSQAAAGRTLPTLAVVRAFVQACGGDVEAWERRWRETARAATPPGAPREDAAAEPQLSADRASAPDPSAGPKPEQPRLAARSRWRRGGKPRRRLARTLAAAAAIVGVAGAAAVLAWPAAPRRGAGAVDPVADGSDPTRAGCGPGAVTLATANVHFPAGQLSGELDLRYSPRCHMAWGRFEPATGWNPGPGTMVTVWTIRPADEATQAYTVEYGGEAVIGNMLTTAHGCVAAEVSMTRGQAASPVATTVCFTVS
jgi:transcriptional regulator with XRE-family HTH domain